MNTKSTPARKSARVAAKTRVARAQSVQPAGKPTKSSKGQAAPASIPEPAAAGTKQSQVIAMLRAPAGGTMEQLTTLTGWQRHTVRGTISGTLRKRLKLNVACASGTYRIIEQPA